MKLSGVNKKKATEMLDPKLKQELYEKWDNLTDQDDKIDCPYDCFLGGLMMEVIYRELCDGIADGNWEETAGQWNLTESDYQGILNAMKKVGFESKMQDW